MKTAKALIDILAALDDMPDDETRCRVMAAACAMVGEYRYAVTFAEIAAAEKAEAKVTPAAPRCRRGRATRPQPTKRHADADDDEQPEPGAKGTP